MGRVIVVVKPFNLGHMIIRHIELKVEQLIKQEVIIHIVIMVHFGIIMELVR